MTKASYKTSCAAKALHWFNLVRKSWSSTLHQKFMIVSPHVIHPYSFNFSKSHVENLVVKIVRHIISNILAQDYLNEINCNSIQPLFSQKFNCFGNLEPKIEILEQAARLLTATLDIISAYFRLVESKKTIPNSI